MALHARYRRLDEAVRHLKVGDIVMVRGKVGLVPKLVRAATKSHWSHTALVFDVPSVSGTEHDVLIVEANWQIEVHRLSTYLLDPDWEVGFKRVDCLDDEERDRFRGFFLDAVDTPYDTKRLAVFFLQTLLTWIFRANISLAQAKDIIDTNQYICTTFTQRALYLAVAPEKRGQVIFRDEPGLDLLAQMEQIAPKDIARSKNTSWLYNPHI